MLSTYTARIYFELQGLLAQLIKLSLRYTQFVETARTLKLR